MNELRSMDRDTHIVGLLRLIDPVEKDRMKRAFETAKGRTKWLHKRLAHQVEMHPDHSNEIPRGERDEESLLNTLRKLGAPEECYVVASDHATDDSFQSLSILITERYAEFGHGTIFSCLPGKLAFFKTAFPHKRIIVHRK